VTRLAYVVVHLHNLNVLLLLLMMMMSHQVWLAKHLVAVANPAARLWSVKDADGATAVAWRNACSLAEAGVRLDYSITTMRTSHASMAAAADGATAVAWRNACSLAEAGA
jgi:hypothetical protein